MRTTSSTTLVALVAAALTVTFWAAKDVAIALAGGLDRSPLESPLFLTGFAACMVAAVTLGVALTAGRPLGLRILAGLLGPVVGSGAAFGIDSALSLIRPADPSWVWAEINLWVLGTAVLVLALVVARRNRAVS